MIDVNTGSISLAVFFPANYEKNLIARNGFEKWETCQFNMMVLVKRNNVINEMTIKIIPRINLFPIKSESFKFRSGLF